MCRKQLIVTVYFKLLTGPLNDYLGLSPATRQFWIVSNDYLTEANNNILCTCLVVLADVSKKHH